LKAIQGFEKSFMAQLLEFCGMNAYGWYTVPTWNEEQYIMLFAKLSKYEPHEEI
jgi:hypothetical protein